MKTAVYIRKSTLDQSLETQRQQLIEYCTNRGLKYNIYEDKESGKKESRPGFDRLLKDIRSGKIDTVIVWKLDRIGRSLQHLLKLFEEFNQRNVNFISITQHHFDTTTPEGKLMLHMMMILAEYERGMIIFRTKQTLERYKRDLDRRGYFITKDGQKLYSLGRPKGKKDGSSVKRTKSSYYEGWKKRREKLVEKGTP